MIGGQAFSGLSGKHLEVTKTTSLVFNRGCGTDNNGNSGDDTILLIIRAQFGFLNLLIFQIVSFSRSSEAVSSFPPTLILKERCR